MAIIMEAQSTRLLVYPRANSRESAGIFVHRIARELHRRNYSYTSFPFHYTGRSVIPWTHAFAMGFARFVPQLLADRRPSVHTLGQTFEPAHTQALGIDRTAEQQLILKRGFSILASGRKIVFISKHVRGIWQRLAEEQKMPWPDASLVRVIYHALNLDEFRPPSLPPSGPFVIGSAGALRFPFRLATLFQVSRRLRFDHRILLVGSMDDDCKRIMSEAMKDPELAARTSYVPWVDSEALPPLYQRMHCLFHPVSGEPCGIVVTEALACGVPVVVPAYGGPSEFVLPQGGIAVQAKPYQHDDEFCDRMADAVAKIRENHDSFARGARHQAELHLSITAAVNEYLDMLDLPRRHP
jgi:glycosyltransferase involved in cell wall biosynthesis